jgi:hypothetical protein
MVHLLDRHSSAYASIQFRALRQFFKWLPATGIYQLIARRAGNAG